MRSTWALRSQPLRLEPMHVGGLQEQASVDHEVVVVQLRRRAWKLLIPLIQRTVPDMKHGAGYELVRRQKIRQHSPRRAVVLRQEADQEVLVELIRRARVEDLDVVDLLAS